MHHQMDELQWSIETFFYYLVTDKFMMIPKIMDLVSREYIKMIQRLTSDEKRNLFTIEAVLNDAHQQNWRQAKRNLDGARLQYQYIILPYWTEEKEQHDRLQDLQLRAKAQIHQHHSKKRKSKTSKTATKETERTDSNKKLSMKQRLFSKSRASGSETVDENSMKKNSNENGYVTSRTENIVLPSIKQENQKVSQKPVKESDVLCTRQSKRQQSVRQRVLAGSKTSDEADTISTRQSLLSGVLEIGTTGQDISYINDSQKMKAESPDEPDHSDTIAEKIAEAFNEVYECEWQDAFKEIKKLQAGKQSPMKDRDIIKCLREIVLKTYSFCTEESTKQVTLMEQACVCIMTTGELKGAQDFKLVDSEYKEFIFEYRKHMADVSIFRVQNIFVFNYLDKILDKYSLKRASKSALSAYTKKCVELSWWMVVQCPPIYLLPGDEDGLFDNKIYKHYKKGGKFKIIEFIVWPALFTKEGGPVLSKGIAQG
ncbi:uncharacterized protein LOC123558379 [Mercenaria mercenaria]|uniref:uncharacterized protein LOC123558379 n=1 Tax=Mercenaria mercenaria TaxID=6596 RepID=UPI00234E5BEA|nr:uncharacterized protein LOC123558379 [Mercenaria mercenaria]